jgi:hypothetical protein
MTNQLIPSIDIFTIIGETLEAILHSDAQTKQFIFVDTKQQWYNAIIASDRQDIGNNETIRPLLWKRIYKALAKSDSLQVPVYSNEWFDERLGVISVDSFVNAALQCATINPILWQRLVIGAADRIDYLNFFSYVLNTTK